MHHIIVEPLLPPALTSRSRRKAASQDALAAPAITNLPATVARHMPLDLEKTAPGVDPLEHTAKGYAENGSVRSSGRTSAPNVLGKTTTGHLEISIKDADVTLAFMREHGASVPPITPEQERKLSRKVFLRVYFLTWIICLVLYTDKATLSYSVRLASACIARVRVRVGC